MPLSCRPWPPRRTVCGTHVHELFAYGRAPPVGGCWLRALSLKVRWATFILAKVPNARLCAASSASTGKTSTVAMQNRPRAGGYASLRHAALQAGNCVPLAPMMGLHIAGVPLDHDSGPLEQAYLRQHTRWSRGHAVWRVATAKVGVAVSTHPHILPGKHVATRLVRVRAHGKHVATVRVLIADVSTADLHNVLLASRVASRAQGGYS